MGALRATSILAGFFVLTIPLMPVQAVLLRTSSKAARRLPNWYHRQVCRILGVTLSIEGQITRDKPVLLVCNHTSWLDIPVLSAVAPVSFVAKKEVGGWPFVASLARLQRSVFVDRNRRQKSGEAASEISERLAAGDTIVLFAEGTSSDGNRVLPFKTSLFGAVEVKDDVARAVVVQTAAIVYTHLAGIPLSRSDRPKVSWYGDMEMQSHAWAALQNGPLKVTIRIGEPVALETFGNRKELALTSERAVRRDALRIVRGLGSKADFLPVEPDAAQRQRTQAVSPSASKKWT